MVNKVDSALPPGEALRRFTAGMPAVTELAHGAVSRDALVSRFMTALAESDTAGLVRLGMSRAEYGFLYFPSSVYARQPYELAPEIAWMLNDQSSAKGLSRVRARLGGRKLKYRTYTCRERARESENTFWRGCTVTYRDPAGSGDETRALFGVIMERNGRFKFLSFANDF